MIYYRVAFQGEHSPGWQWKSTVLTSPNSVFAFLSVYSAFPKDRTRVFFASRPPSLDQMRSREDAGLVSNSIRADHLLQGKQGISRLEMQRLETELLAPVNWEGATLNSGAAHTGHSIEAPEVSAFLPDFPIQERARGDDLETPYHFTAADSWLQALAWIKLLTKVHRSELEP